MGLPTPEALEFDYVIVGGGSGGATLAARLSEDPKITVCLIEAGGAGKSPIVRVPALVLGALHGGRLANLNWGFETEPQPALNGRTGYHPRGKGLGGSSAVNAMIYIRGNPRDYNGWKALGCDGWGWEDVLPYFLRSERNARGSNALHSSEGPLHVTELQSPYAINEEFIQSCEALQIPRNNDFNGPSQGGAGLYQVTHFHDHRSGTRCSAAAAYLHPVMSRENLHVVTHAMAEQITFDEGRATGVILRRRGERLTLRARGEVILSAGAFQSPQLLMTSGVGPAKALSEHGIPVIADRAEVGQNLQDHPDFIMAYKVKTPDVMGISGNAAWRGLRGIFDLKRNGTGFWTSNIAESGAFYSVDADPDWPDIQLHFAVACVQDHGRKLVPGHAISLHTCILRPESRGSVSIRSSDTRDAPVIDNGFFTNAIDMERMLKGVEVARQIMGAEPIAGQIVKDMTTGHVQNRDNLEEIIRAEADTVYHPVGTCRMGADAASVVDTRLRVRGVRGLRVVDASIMPRLISGNTNAPTIMIAEKAADMIREDARAV